MLPLIEGQFLNDLVLDGRVGLVLETLTDDVPEAFFFSFSSAAAHRFLGARFRTDGGKNPAYAGPYYSIYQKLATIPGSKTPTHKLYFFDATTGLLSGVQYVGSKPGTTVQFSNWQTVSGERYPGQIVRMTGGTVEFTMTCHSFTFASTGNSAIFGQH